jgi:tetratricopeptide (TPR) repeat protein
LYFDDLACSKGVDQRIVEELPWQFARANLKRKLIDTLTDEAVFEELFDRDQSELIKYWLDLGRAPSSYYEKAWGEWKANYETFKDNHELSRAGFRLAEFLRKTGSTSSLLEEMYGQSLDAAVRNQDECPQEYLGQSRIAIENSRGLFLENQGRLTDAELIFRTCLENLESEVGRYHPDALDAINNLSVNLWRQGKNSEANELSSEVLSQRLQLFGENHERTISTLITCGNITGALGRSDESLEFFRRALKSSKKVLGADSERTFGIMMNLAGGLTNAGQFVAASDLYEKSLRGLENVLGKMHPDTIRCASGYGNCLRQSGDFNGAERIYKRVLAAREKIFGLYHYSVCNSLQDAALNQEKQGNLREAERYYRMSVRRRIKVFGVSHLDTARAVNNLANILDKLRDTDGMEKVLFSYLKKLDNELPPDADLTLQTVNYLGVFKNKNGKLEQALSFLKKRASVSASVMDGVRYNLACYECMSGNLEQAMHLIAEHIKKHPEHKEYALADADLDAIRCWIEPL